MFARLTQLFLDANTARMPERLERGLVALFSTIQVNGIRITLGEPPSHPDMDWARVHLLAVDPEYYGKLRVLTYNLRKGVDEDAAFRNAFGKSPEQIELEAQAHLAARAVSGHLDFAAAHESAWIFRRGPWMPTAAQLAIADLLLGDQSRDHLPGADRAKRARAGSLGRPRHAGAARPSRPMKRARISRPPWKPARRAPECYMEYARLEPDNAKALAALRAGRQDQSQTGGAAFSDGPARKPIQPKRIQELKLAAKLDARNLAYWEALAEAYLDAHDYPQAAQAWKSAEQAATTPGDRARMQRQRLEVEDAAARLGRRRTQAQGRRRSARNR